MADYIVTLLLLFALELVLGVDNIVVITILVSRLPQDLRHKARFIGLGIALVARLAMVWAFGLLLGLNEAVLAHLSVRDIILLIGGAFLIWKAVREIHHTVEMVEGSDSNAGNPQRAFAMAIATIVAVDIVFALDSVVTAFGMTDEILVIWAAVILSFIVILIFAQPIGEFIHRNPTFKILALSFLITIGIVLILEGLHHEVPKAYIYLPMGFATLVQLLQWRLYQNQSRKNPAPPARDVDG